MNPKDLHVLEIEVAWESTSEQMLNSMGHRDSAGGKALVLQAAAWQTWFNLGAEHHQGRSRAQSQEEPLNFTGVGPNTPAL